MGIKPGQAKKMDINQMYPSQLKKKDAETVDNMFKQAGFFNKFMDGVQKEEVPPHQNPVEPMMASLYNKEFDYPTKSVAKK